MKASKHFVATLTNGIGLLAHRYGMDVVEQQTNWTIFFKVADAVTEGQQHNAVITMDLDPTFSEERKELTDAHIETATKQARKIAATLDLPRTN